MSEFARLLVQHIPRLRRYARALTGDVSRADDLLQDSLERAWSRPHLWREGDMRAWLFAIMHNVFANSARAYQREPQFVPVEETDAVTPPDQDFRLELNDLKAAIDSLPYPQREVILLIGLEQLSYTEAAQVLGIPVGTVMSRLTRARQRLRRTLREAMAQRPPLRRVK